jgi:hypothetical protein
MTEPEAVEVVGSAETDEPAAPPRTGLPDIDSAVADIADAADSAPAEQIGVYEAAHQRLQNALTAIEEG